MSTKLTITFSNSVVSSDQVREASLTSVGNMVEWIEVPSFSNELAF